MSSVPVFQCTELSKVVLVMVTVESLSMKMLPPRAEAELLMNFESSRMNLPL